jgi:chorismate-pyruvate lyase
MSSHGRRHREFRGVIRLDNIEEWRSLYAHPNHDRCWGRRHRLNNVAQELNEP